LLGSNVPKCAEGTAMCRRAQGAFGALRSAILRAPEPLCPGSRANSTHSEGSARASPPVYPRESSKLAAPPAYKIHTGAPPTPGEGVIQCVKPKPP